MKTILIIDDEEKLRKLLAKIIPLLNRATEKVELSKRVHQLQKQLSYNYSFENILGKSKVIKAAIHAAKKVSATDATVLLTGETGTGKEILNMKNLVKAAIFLAAANTYAQTESSKSPLTFSGYLETYYVYDFAKPDNNTRPNFVYSFNRHNEVNLNLGLVKAAYQKDNVRANLAMATGTYMNANLAAEPGVLKNIFEANAGVKISKNKNIWIDAGIFAGHIGFESAIGKDNWKLTRSILAENSPYFESGAKISYTSDNEKWFVSGLILNGWQRIQRVNGNHTPAFGHQLTYKPNSKVTLNSSSFIGNDKPDVVSQMRYFHNFYGQFQITDNIGLIAGFDCGMEQKSHRSDEYNTWYTPVVIAKIKADNKHSIAGRIEYYSDENGVIISSAAIGGFKTFGYSINYDTQIIDNVVWRVEARGFSGNDNTFEKAGKPSKSNFFLASSLAISF